MTKKLTNFVSLLFSFKRISIVMSLATVLLLSGSVQIFASSTDDQQKVVKGRVTDESGAALPGVNVLEKNTTNGVTADVDGKYTISVASSNSVLVFSFIGYTSREAAVGALSTVDISLTQSLTGLDEIIVVGYGTQQKRAISGSVTKVTEKDFNAGITRFRVKSPD
jgi:hypothetical protein